MFGATGERRPCLGAEGERPPWLATWRGEAAMDACAKLRLRLDKTAKGRPGSGFEVAGAKLVRGAYEITPAAKGAATTATVTFTG